MSGAMREKDQGDFDLERFVDMFDEAMTSQDPRVMKTLRDLMMIAALTRPESRDSGLHDRNHGPLRRLYEDVNHLSRRLNALEDELRQRDYAQNEQKIASKYAYTRKHLQDQIDLDGAKQIASQINSTLLPPT